MGSKRGSRGRRGPRGRWCSRAEVAAALGISMRTVDRRRRDIDPRGDLGVRRYGGKIRIWVPELLEESPEARLSRMERRLTQETARIRNLELQLTAAMDMFIELYASVYGIDVDIEDWLTRQLRVQRLQRLDSRKG